MDSAGCDGAADAGLLFGGCAAGDGAVGSADGISGAVYIHEFVIVQFLVHCFFLLVFIHPYIR